MSTPEDPRFSFNVYRDPASVRGTARKRPLRKDGKGRKDEGGELVPVEPDKPRPLSGGAAAALEFDD